MAIIDNGVQNTTLVGCFKVKNPPNPYASTENNANTSDAQERSLQIKILDVLYNNQICSLVFMHDVTKVIGDYSSRPDPVTKTPRWGEFLIKRPD